MPVSKMEQPKECCGGGKCDCGHMCGCGGFVKKLMLTLLGVLLVYGIFLVGTMVRNNIKKYDYIGKADRMERTLMVNGYGKINGNNDIAMTTIGFSNTDKDVAKAQAANKAVMDKVFADLKKLGVADKDLQTNYTIYPEYNYTQDKGQLLVGYRVNEQLTVKIRDLAKITEVLGLAGKYGANEVGGLSFTIDDPENLKEQAREKAIADARAKALVLAARLGVRLGGVISYNEYEGSNDYYPLKAMSSIVAEGGGMSAAPAQVAAGSKDVVMNVNVNFEILP